MSRTQVFFAHPAHAAAPNVLVVSVGSLGVDKLGVDAEGTSPPATQRKLLACGLASGVARRGSGATVLTDALSPGGRVLPVFR